MLFLIFCIFMNKIEAINQKLEDIKKKRRENRKLRLYAPKLEQDTLSEPELLNYVFSQEEPFTFSENSIKPQFFDPPPPSPVISLNSNALEYLSLLFPIGRSRESCKDGSDWYIVSPFIHVPMDFVANPEWANSVQRFLSAISYASRLLLLLSKACHRSLPYPIAFVDKKILIYMKNKPHELSAITNKKELQLSVPLLNFNAYSFAQHNLCRNGKFTPQPNQLLPNLYFALHPDATEFPPIEENNELQEI